MTHWQFNWITDWDEAWTGAGADQWRETFVRSRFANPYHRPELIRHWYETCGRKAGATAMIGLAENRAGDRIVLPVAMTEANGRYANRRVLEYAGGALFGYHDPLVLSRSRERIDWTRFWQAVKEETRHACDLGLLRFVHPDCAGTRQSTMRTENNPVLDLSGFNSLEDILDACSGNHRRDVRRRLRRIQEAGDLRLWCAASSDAADAGRDFEGSFAPAYVDQSRARPDRCLFRFPGVRNFCERVIEHGVRDGWAHYCALRMNGQSIAWHLGLLHNKQLYWWVPTYRREWQRSSPGKILLALLVEHGLTSGWSHIHFLTGGHDYKLAWRPTPHYLQTVRWHAPTCKGTFLKLYDSLRGTPKARHA